jgi:hypothetical protein
MTMTPEEAAAMASSQTVIQAELDKHKPSNQLRLAGDALAIVISAMMWHRAEREGTDPTIINKTIVELCLSGVCMTIEGMTEALARERDANNEQVH